MKRYLIHHDDGGTWDLVVDGDAWSVEQFDGVNRRKMSVDEFKASADGARLAAKFTDAVGRAKAEMT